MSNLKYLKTAPARSIFAQRLGNAYPTGKAPSEDPHSNYQAIMSDLSEDLEILGNSFLEQKKEYLFHKNTGSTNYVYGYLPGTQGIVNQNGKTVYLEPLLVTDNGYALPALREPSLFPFDKNIQYGETTETELTSDLKIVDTEGIHSYIFSVKRNSFLHVHLDGEYLQEDLYIREKDYLIFPYLSLQTYPEGKEISRTEIVGLSFISLGMLNPGCYRLKLCSNVDVPQIENFSLYTNFKFPILAERFFPASFFVDSQRSLVTFYEIDNSVVNLITFTVDTEGYLSDTKEILLSWQLLTDSNEEIIPYDYFIYKDILYFRTQEDPGTIYIYDLSLQGNRYMYLNNKDWWLKLLIPNTEIKTGDELILETREIQIRPKSFMNLRLKIENLESETTIYVAKDGTEVEAEDAWVEYSIQSQKWKVTLNNLGSYKFTIEYDDEEGIKVAGEKLLTLQYSYPKETISINETNGVIGLTPENKLMIGTAGAEETSFLLDTKKKGYYWDPSTGIIWTNSYSDNLEATYVP